MPFPSPAVGEDEISYARNVSFIDYDLDAGELGGMREVLRQSAGGYLSWRVPEDDSEAP